VAEPRGSLDWFIQTAKGDTPNFTHGVAALIWLPSSVMSLLMLSRRQSASDMPLPYAAYCAWSLKVWFGTG